MQIHTKLFLWALAMLLMGYRPLDAESLLHVRVDDGQTTVSGTITGHRFLPDGQSVAYLADPRQGGEHDLLLADIATGDVLNLSHVPGSRVDVEDLRVAPDGQRIVYWGRDLATGVRRLYSVPVSGGPPIVLADDLHTSDVYIPSFEIVSDTHQVVFLDDRVTTDLRQLCRVPAVGGPVEAVTALATTFDVSPDRQWLTISETYQIPKPVPLNYTALSLLKVDDGTTTPLTIEHSLNASIPSPTIFRAFTSDSSRLFYIAEDAMRCIGLPGLAIEQLGKGGADVGEILPGNDRIITLKTQVTKVPIFPDIYSTVTSVSVLSRSRGTTETLTLILKGYMERTSPQAADSPRQRSLSWPMTQSHLDVSPDGVTVLLLFRQAVFQVPSTGGTVKDIDPARSYNSFTAGNGHAVMGGGEPGVRLLDYDTGEIDVLTDEHIDRYFLDAPTDRLYYSTKESDGRLISLSLQDQVPHVLHQHPNVTIPSLEPSPDRDTIVYTINDTPDRQSLPNGLVVAPWNGDTGQELFGTAISRTLPITELVALGHGGDGVFYRRAGSMWRRGTQGAGSELLGKATKWAVSHAGKYLAFSYDYTRPVLPDLVTVQRILQVRTVALHPTSEVHLLVSQDEQLFKPYTYNPPLTISGDNGTVSSIDIYDQPLHFSVDEWGTPAPSPGRAQPALKSSRGTEPPITHNGSPVDWGQVVVSRTSADGRWIALLAPLDGPQKELYAARLPDGEVFKLNRPLYPQTDVEDDFLINANGSFIAYRANEGDGDVYLYGTTLVDEARSAFIAD